MTGRHGITAKAKSRSKRSVHGRADSKPYVTTTRRLIVPAYSTKTVAVYGTDGLPFHTVVVGAYFAGTASEYTASAKRAYIFEILAKAPFRSGFLRNDGDANNTYKTRSIIV